MALTPTMDNSGSKSNETIEVICTDVDGTLVHYPDDVDSYLDREDIIFLPKSTTGLQGIISIGTLQKFDDLKKLGKKIIIVSGMRTATMLARIPYLPRADAYCSEDGGRIFYPVDENPTSQPGGTLYRQYPYEGSNLTPFTLHEDKNWRRKMERTVGTSGFVWNELKPKKGDVISYSDRRSILWDFARLLETKGFVIDSKGYSTCFRLRRKEQTSDAKFDSLAQVPVPPGLSVSANLGNIDYYPVDSGKKNCCDYVAAKFLGTTEAAALGHALCLCDDDNDLEMALACRHAYVPSVTSDSMRDTAKKNPKRITVTSGPGGVFTGPKATERALNLVKLRVIRDRIQQF
eukprot:CAMPEP_0116841744 /NCGR_PEP_ID=MMETSP0418-20121206/11117_1 /TAXON_ID=1158023 /ORGANISM="Astrosyne radiata, Strain 13vi08-1A" /LENGTH=346 /DNA_ID=CAMNT_0004472249 /DNA_START=182 /DNA_END=1222 /DNA_ORIENTATION=+